MSIYGARHGMQPDPHTPVIVGIGFRQERTNDPLASSEAWALMAQAVQAAAADAGSARLLEQIESISVARGMWQYRNPGKLIADRLGFPGATTALADLGILQLTPLADLCRAITAGERTIGVVTGGEAQFRELRSMITRQPVTDTVEPDDTPPPDVYLTSVDPFCSDLENRRGITTPTELFAIMESSLRHAEGLHVDAHRDRLARLYAGFSEIAAQNPHAWRREPTPAAEIRDAAMLAFPYTKRHCSSWNVNQAVAILVCSVARARALGLDDGGWIYPLAAVESKHVVVLAQQRRLHSHPGTVLCGERALALAGATTRDVTAAELYSCFPAAIQSFAHDLKLEPECPLTVTGSMAFSGGPFNSFSLEGVARMVEVLRDGAPAERRIGLVSNLSGIFGKQACMLLSNVAGADGYRYEDVTAAVAERDVPVPLDAEYIGPATIAGYTVVFAGGTPSHAVAICDTPGGKRTVARSDDGALLVSMMRDEYCGRAIVVDRGGGFSVGA